MELRQWERCSVQNSDFFKIIKMPLIPAEDTSADENSYTLCFGEILFGTEKDSIEVSALEMYSRPHSEHRIGYKGTKVCMDIGPEGETK